MDARLGRRNIPTLYWLEFLFMFDFVVALRQIIYTDGGLSQTAIGIVLAVPWVVIALTDIPTGRLADLYSYRSMIVIGSLTLMASFILLATAQGFGGFLLSAVVAGVGAACYRGAPAALAKATADQLHIGEPTGLFAAFTRWRLTVAAAAEAAASLGAFLLIWWLGDGMGRTVVICIQVGVCMAMYVLAAWWLVDIHGHRAAPRTVTLRYAIFGGWKQTFANIRLVFHTTPLVRAIVVYGAVIGCTTQTMVWLTLVYLQRTGVPQSNVLLHWLAFHAALALFTLVIAFYEKLLGWSGALTSLPIIATVAYVLLIWGDPRYVKWAITAFYFVRAIQMALVLRRLLELTPAHLSATIQGVMSTIQFGMFFVMMIVLNASVDLFPGISHGTGVAFGISAVVYGVGGMLAARQVRRYIGTAPRAS
jgi:MFS family permease